MLNYIDFGQGAVLAVIGWLAGILVNWLADQLPFVGVPSKTADSTESENTPEVAFRSHISTPRCKHCGRQYVIIEYSGFLAFVTGRLVCSQCNRKRSYRDIIVESFLAVGVTYIILTVQPIGTAIAITFYLVAFTLVSVIDIEHRWVLNIIVIPLFAIALIETVVSGRVAPPNGLKDALEGFAVGQIIITAVYLGGELYLWNLNRRRKEPVTEVAFGTGDISLATLSGLILGAQLIVFGLILTFAVGFLMIIAFLLAQILSGKGYKPNVPIAYGPAILISCLAMLLWSDRIIALMYGSR